VVRGGPMATPSLWGGRDHPQAIGGGCAPPSATRGSHVATPLPSLFSFLFLFFIFYFLFFIFYFLFFIFYFLKKISLFIYFLINLYLFINMDTCRHLIGDKWH